ncbi:hypothetical protein CIHG_00398 [Coccidioides immitis H538.4]|uniref:Uncharacterized protein n=2 Tax=Coccidioides immitis TaxID=5501 RepID=A0A0J8RCG9_COCIT|nr:hypothetical protein CIRG_07216 [Coccidioides immitis RMSCC 2394]KMU82617.1 hypothetical protein CIHG_00398 [Coccidioides immitis H538.4]
MREKRKKAFQAGGTVRAVTTVRIRTPDKGIVSMFALQPMLEWSLIISAHCRGVEVLGKSRLEGLVLAQSLIFNRAVFFAAIRSPD